MKKAIILFFLLAGTFLYAQKQEKLFTTKNIPFARGLDIYFPVPLEIEPGRIYCCWENIDSLTKDPFSVNCAEVAIEQISPKIKSLFDNKFDLTIAKTVFKEKDIVSAGETTIDGERTLFLKRVTHDGVIYSSTSYYTLFKNRLISIDILVSVRNPSTLNESSEGYSDLLKKRFETFCKDEDSKFISKIVLIDKWKDLDRKDAIGILARILSELKK